MSNEEDKRCPLCAEEMDWTDQQFKPCKCGYQVCVWCWHHIMDMAEKDETDGRCPACRTIYEKEKIVAMQANFNRAATDTMNQKAKPPKIKTKINEVKRDLTNVRVIQRKMAYVIGLPLTLADEELLQHKEYFGQYGKVSKVSLSRTAGGAIQQFVNDTCSVYITYSKEEEAVRCIQSVHGFVLDGRCLRASFGTAKYCHAWLKHMPCNNPSCLYLHTIGAEEDSFSKDEVAAIHTRNRVQQIVGLANNMTRRAGNLLPPPVDEFANMTSSSADKLATNSSQTSDAHVIGSTSNHKPHVSFPKDKDGAAPNKISFVDIVGRSSTSGSEKDGDVDEARSMLNLCSNLSSVSLDKDIQNHGTSPDSILPKVASSSRLVNPLHEEPSFAEFNNELLREDWKNSNASSQKTSLLHSYHSVNVPNDLSSYSLLHKRTHSLNSFGTDHNPMHNSGDGTSQPFTCVNSVLTDDSHEMKFQNSAKSDRVYRNSNSFSNEEIVEHLRRIDGDNSTNGDVDSALDTVESSIISNIMSMDFDSFGDSLTMPHRSDGFGSRMADLNSSFGQVGEVSKRCSVFQDFEDSNGHYFSKLRDQVSRSQSSAPPGFSVPTRDPPPGFPSCENRGRFSRAASGNHLVNTSLTTLLNAPSPGSNCSIGEMDLVDPAILSCGKGTPTNGPSLYSAGIDMGTARPPRLAPFDDEARLWLLMQQSKPAHQDLKLPQTYAQQSPYAHQELIFPGHTGDRFHTLDSLYGLSSRLIDQQQSYNLPPYTHFSEQKPVEGPMFNGYQRSLNDIQHVNGVGMVDLQKNERLGLDKYLPGYGDLRFQMPSSGDMYTRVFGM